MIKTRFDLICLQIFDGTTTNTSLEVITVEPNTRHRFRLINSFCSVCPGQITIEGHNLTVIETDGQPITPINVTSIVSSAGTESMKISSNN